MEILRNLLGKLASGVVRLLLVAGILVAAYLLLVRPALDKTEKLGHDASREVEHQIRRAVHTARGHGAGEAKRLVKCIERADGDVHRITRCTAKL